MATPSRAPRRTAAQMNLNIASGVPSPGANSYQTARQSSGLTPGSVPQTKGGSSGSVSGSEAYMNQRNAAKVGLTPENVAVNKDTSPQP